MVDFIDMRVRTPDATLDVGGGIRFLRDDSWHHICVTWSAAEAAVEVFLDAGSAGELRWASSDPHPYGSAYDDSFAGSPPVQTEPLAGPSYLLLGRAGGIGADQAFGGDLDEVCLWNERLAGASVAADVRVLGCAAGAPANAGGLLIDVGFDGDRDQTMEPSVFNSAVGAFAGIRGGLHNGYVRDAGALDGTHHVPSSLPVALAGKDVVVAYNARSGAATAVRLPCDDCNGVEVASLPSSGALAQGEDEDDAITAPGTAVLTTEGTGPDGEDAWWVLYFPNDPADDDSAAYADDSFTYTGSDGDGNSATATVRLTPNSPPVADEMTLEVNQGGSIVTALPSSFAFDADGDTVDAVVDTLPGSGVSLGQLGVPRGDLDRLPVDDDYVQSYYDDDYYLYRNQEVEDIALGDITDAPEAVTGAFGIVQISADAAATAGTYNFTYHVTDGFEPSPPATVTIKVNAVNRVPQPVPSAAETDEDESVEVLAASEDAEGDGVYIVVSSLPEHGSLFQRALGGGKGERVALASPLQRLSQWAASATASTFWPSSTSDQLWGPGYIAGPPEVFPDHGEAEKAWQPNELGEFGVPDWRKQWVEVRLEVPVVVERVEVYETWHPGSLYRISTWHEEHGDHGEWDVIWSGEPDIVERFPDPTVTASDITSPTLCPSSFTTDRVRLDFDMVSFDHWIAVDSVRVIGTTSLAANVVADAHSRLIYEPDADYNGADEFSYVVSDCAYYQANRELNAEDRTGVVELAVEPVNDPPVSLLDDSLGTASAAVAVLADENDATALDVVTSAVFVTLAATDAEDESLTLVVTQLPSDGRLLLLDEDGGAGDAIASVPYNVPEASAAAEAAAIAATAAGELASSGLLVRPYPSSARTLLFDPVAACGSFSLSYEAVDGAGAKSAESTVSFTVDCVEGGISLGVLLVIIAGAAAIVLCLGAAFVIQVRKHKKVVETLNADYVERTLRTASKRVRQALKSQLFVQFFFFALEAFDITTDWVAFTSILENLRAQSTSFLIMYTSLLSVGTAVGAMALLIRIRTARAIYSDATRGIDMSELGVLSRVDTAKVSDIRDALPAAKDLEESGDTVQGFFFDEGKQFASVRHNNPKHRLRTVRRSLATLKVTLALAVFEDIPMASLNIVILFGLAVPPSEASAVVVSIFVSMLMLGVKLRSIDRLVALRADEAELEGKLALVAAKKSSHSLVPNSPDVQRMQAPTQAWMNGSAERHAAHDAMKSMVG